MGLRDVEEAAAASRLLLEGTCSWSYNGDFPHISEFDYAVWRFDDNGEATDKVGEVSGYRITQNRTVHSDLALWAEADAATQDAVIYTEALIRELRICQAVFGVAPHLSDGRRTTIVTHLQPEPGQDSGRLLRDVCACLAMMDAPVFMLVDPRLLPDERKKAMGKLIGRSHFPPLMELGFVRMVGSAYAWGWNSEQEDMLMSEYSHDALVAAKENGDLDSVLKSRLVREFYKGISDEAADLQGYPDLTMDDD